MDMTASHKKTNKMKRTLLALTVALTSGITAVNAQIVNIPDANFKAYLVGNTNINTNGDNEIQESEAASYTGDIECNDMGIADLTGIEAFTSLTSLVCSDNQLTVLDVTNNMALEGLDCSFNQLTALNVTQNTVLLYLICSGNQLTTLDVSNNEALLYLWCSFNQLTTLDVTNNVAIEYLWCDINQLTSLNVLNNTALADLDCSFNQLTTLDVSNNTALQNLVCSYNQLIALDVSNNTLLMWLECSFNQLTTLNVSNNAALEYLECSLNQLNTLEVSNDMVLRYLLCGANQLTALDVSSNIALEELDCSYNQLTVLNAQNGNNISFTDFNASSNPNLTCIQVDDAAYSTANWTGGNFQFDAQTSFSENCTISVNDINERNYFSIYPNPTRGIINFSTPTNVQLLSVTGQVISENKNVSTLNLSDQPSGIYLLILSDRKGQVIQRSKVMKE